jgi:hypothetical protein
LYVLTRHIGDLCTEALVIAGRSCHCDGDTRCDRYALTSATTNRAGCDIANRAAICEPWSTAVDCFE